MAYIMQSSEWISASGDGVISDWLIADKRYFGQPVVSMSIIATYACRLHALFLISKPLEMLEQKWN